MQALLLDTFGGVDALRVGEIDAPEATASQTLVDVRLAGVNFADISRRLGTYDRRSEPPLILGAEVAGTRRDTGRRVVALTGGYGGYAQVVAVDERLTFPVPDALDDHSALALFLQGLTAYHVLRTCGGVQPGDAVVIHAAAGGVGSVAVQLAKRWNAGTVIGLASTQDKRDLVLALGADIALDSASRGLGDRILAANGGMPVDVIAEMAGGEAFDESLQALAPDGRIVVFGTASRTARNVPAGAAERVVDFSLPSLYDRRDRLAEPLAEIFQAAIAKAITPVLGGVYGLVDAARAHADLAARRTSGKLAIRV
jgi:NADPH2:quinone reductase